MSQQKLLRTVLNLAVAGTLGALVGCGGQSSDSTKTVTSSTAIAVASQSIVQNDTSSAMPLCLEANADPDGDGWGWENQTTCLVDSQDPVVQPQSDPTPISVSRSDLPVGIIYFLWHCADTASKEYNITEVLSGQSDWGPGSSFHWWDEPTEGYYCLGERRDIIATHLKQLRDAGVDYLVLDITNHPNTVSLDAETLILKSLRPLLEVARTIPNAPKIVPWVPLTSDSAATEEHRASVCNANNNSNNCRNLQQAQPMYQHVTNLLTNEFPELMFEYKGKPLLMEAANDRKFPRAKTDIVRPQLENTWTVQRLWGLQLHTNDWQFLSTCNNPVEFYQSNGWSAEGCNQPVNAGEQISVSAAYQYTYISEQFTPDAQSYAGYTGGMPKFHGRTLAQQFRVAFEERDSQPMVLLTGWNEWIAQPTDFNNHKTFVDLYDDNLNRDIEPGGASGDFYYHLMTDLIAQYRKDAQFSFEDYFLTSNSILDADYYWATHTDLQATFERNDELGLLNHWLTVGLQEGRRPSVAFNADHYRNQYPDLANAGVTSAEQLLNHFINSGFSEGRVGSADFHAATYLARYPQLAEAYGNNGYYKSFNHYVRIGQFAPLNHNAKQ